MNKFLRILSTLVVGIGLILLFVYLNFQNSVGKAQVLNQPSYYTLQNYWYLLVAGCGCVAFSVISCFLAWSKRMDEKVEILPNAVAAEKTELMGWLSGSSLDTDRKANAKHTEKPVDMDIAAGKTAAQEHGSSDGTVLRQDADGNVMCGDDTVCQPVGQAVEDVTVGIHSETVTMTERNDEATILTERWETISDEDATVIQKQ